MVGAQAIFFCVLLVQWWCFRADNISGSVDSRSTADSSRVPLTGKVSSAGTDNNQSDSKAVRRDLIALEQWALSLTDRDYDYNEWRKSFHSRSTVDFFNGYAKKLSSLFNSYNAKVNFVMVGACDGTGDNTIKHLYLPNQHWRGVFVEPLTMNVRDLIGYMSNHQASHRSMIIQAAATAECKTPTIVMERPLYEEKNASIPHWLRRQIGSLLPSSTNPKARNYPRRDWTTEEVRCVTATDILREWSASSRNGTAVDKGAARAKERRGAKKRRPHVLKIDVEGHDFEVLMGFLNDKAMIREYGLPLLIDFEAKSIAKKFPKARDRMTSLGYIVSPFGQDGFALLHGDVIRRDLTAAAGIKRIDRDNRKRRSGSKKDRHVAD